MKYYLTIDIGGTFIKYALIDDSYHLLETDKIPTPNTLTDFLTHVKELIATHKQQISGVAIACPGQINSKVGFIHRGGLIPYLRNLPLASHLEHESLLPVTVINDANAAGLAEARLGNLRDCSCGAALILGTGVGLALISDGNLLSFRNLQSHHMLIGPTTNDVQKNARFMAQKDILNLRVRGIESLLQNNGSAVQFIHKASDHLALPHDDGQAVFKVLTENSDTVLIQLFENYCQEIAQLILNLQTVFRLERLVLGGGISCQPLLLKEVQHQYHALLEENDHALSVGKLALKTCRFYNNANLIGAFCHFKDLKLG